MISYSLHMNHLEVSIFNVTYKKEKKKEKEENKDEEEKKREV